VLRFTFSLILLLLVAFTTYGQGTDTLTVASDSIKIYTDSLPMTSDTIPTISDSTFLQSDSLLVKSDSTMVQDTLTSQSTGESVVLKKRQGLEIFIDYGKILTIPTDFERKIEVGLGYRINDKIVPQIHFGVATLEPRVAFNNAVYRSEGSYGTVGINYLGRIDPSSYMYIGAQYGISSFEESYSYIIANPIWPDFTDGASRTGLTASWVAIVIGSEKETGIENLMVGGEFTLRVLLDYEEFSPVDTYAIPGYGRTADNTLPAINVYLKYLIAF